MVSFLLKRLKNAVSDIEKTKEKKLFALLESISRLPFWFWILLELFIASKILILSPEVNHWINIVILFVLLLGA